MQITITLPSDLHTALQHHADGIGVSLEAVLVLAAQDYFSEVSRKAAEAWSRAIAARRAEAAAAPGPLGRVPLRRDRHPVLAAARNVANSSGIARCQ
jgi:predicted transcriptional regulator